MTAELPAQDMLPSRAEPSARRDPWQIAWRSAAGPHLLVIVLLGLALLLLAAAWLPQSPAASEDLALYSRWLALVQHRFGPTSKLMQGLGLFSISDTLLFRVFLALLGCALATRLVDAVELAWNERVPPPPPEDQAADLIPDLSLDQVAADLRRRLWRVSAGDGYLVIDRFPASHLVRVLAVLGGLVLLVSLALSATLGWRSQPLSLGIGQTVALGRDTPYALRLDDWRDKASGQVSLLIGEQVAAAGLVARGQAMRTAGLSVNFQATAPAVRATATLSITGGARALALQASETTLPVGELLLLFGPADAERVFAAPEAGVLTRLRFDPSSAVLYAALYDMSTAKLVAERALPAGGALHAKDAVFTLMPERYMQLVVTHDPGNWPAAIGWLLLIAGLMGSLAWPPHRTWLRTQEIAQVQVLGDALPALPARSAGVLLRRALDPAWPGRAARFFLVSNWPKWVVVAAVALSALLWLSLHNWLMLGSLWPDSAGFKALAGVWLASFSACVWYSGRRPKA
ncbi:MAG: cytochrome c biogenesis protein ResB [Thermoflexales bacterium]|nr:cytochrome c biogenesis protein ResB [Thermoflexales bacterium]